MPRRTWQHNMKSPVFFRKLGLYLRPAYPAAGAVLERITRNGKGEGCSHLPLFVAIHQQQGPQPQPQSWPWPPKLWQVAAGPPRPLHLPVPSLCPLRRPFLLPCRPLPPLHPPPHPPLRLPQLLPPPPHPPRRPLPRPPPLWAPCSKRQAATTPVPAALALAVQQLLDCGVNVDLEAFFPVFKTSCERRKRCWGQGPGADGSAARAV